MANDCAGSLQVCAMRVSRLDAAGAPLAGAENLYITNALITLGLDPEISEGERFEQKNGCNEILFSIKDPDLITGLNLTIELAVPDPELYEILVGGEVLGAGLGWAPPLISDQTAGDGVGIEAWTKAVLDTAQTNVNPWWRWVFPRTKWTLGARTMGNEPMVTPLTGTSEENDGFADGPANDWIYTSDRLYQYARDDDIPDSACGYQTLVAS